MRKHKLANKDQAKAFLFFQLKEAFRHIDDIIGCLEDVMKVCNSFDIDKRDLFYDWSAFEGVYKLKELGNNFDVWVEVQSPNGIEELKL